MHPLRRFGICLIAALATVLASTGPDSAAQGPGGAKKFTIEQVLSPAFPFELVSAKKADRIAWIAYERGQRNVFTAAAPA